MVTSISTLGAALLRPDRAFAGAGARGLSRVLLVLFLFIAYVAGTRLVQGAYENAAAKSLAVQDVDTRMGGIMQNAPTQMQDRIRGQMLDSILGRSSGMTTALQIAFSGVGYLLVLLELWLVSLVAVQFVGGQEDRHARPRLSATLFIVAFIPLALRRLAAGAVMALGSGDAAANALTLADYRSLSAARFDLLSLLHVAGLPAYIASLGAMLTDPFWLWTFAVLVLGGREVYRIRLRGSLGLSAILAAVLALQATLFRAAGLGWEI